MDLILNCWGREGLLSASALVILGMLDILREDKTPSGKIHIRLLTTEQNALGLDLFHQLFQCYQRYCNIVLYRETELILDPILLDYLLPLDRNERTVSQKFKRKDILRLGFTSQEIKVNLNNGIAEVNWELEEAFFSDTDFSKLYADLKKETEYSIVNCGGYGSCDTDAVLMALEAVSHIPLQYVHRFQVITGNVSNGALTPDRGRISADFVYQLFADRSVADAYFIHLNSEPRLEMRQRPNSIHFSNLLNALSIRQVFLHPEHWCNRAVYGCLAEDDDFFTPAVLFSSASLTSYWAFLIQAVIMVLYLCPVSAEKRRKNGSNILSLLVSVCNDCIHLLRLVDEINASSDNVCLFSSKVSKIIKKLFGEWKTFLAVYSGNKQSADQRIPQAQLQTNCTSRILQILLAITEGAFEKKTLLLQTADLFYQRLERELLKSELTEIFKLLHETSRSIAEYLWR